MATKVAKTKIKREKGWLYYLDKKGNVSRARMARGGGKPARGKPQEVTKAGVKREDGFLYFIDRDGDVARTKHGAPRRPRPAVRLGAGLRSDAAARRSPTRRATARGAPLAGARAGWLGGASAKKTEEQHRLLLLRLRRGFFFAALRRDGYLGRGLGKRLAERHRSCPPRGRRAPYGILVVDDEVAIVESIAYDAARRLPGLHRDQRQGGPRASSSARTSRS